LILFITEAQLRAAWAAGKTLGDILDELGPVGGPVKREKAVALLRAAFPSIEIVDGEDRAYVTAKDLAAYRGSLAEQTHGKIDFRSLSGEDIDPDYLGVLYGFDLYRRG
jgi:hypothetical protein